MRFNVLFVNVRNSLALQCCICQSWVCVWGVCCVVPGLNVRAYVHCIELYSLLLPPFLSWLWSLTTSQIPSSALNLFWQCLGSGGVPGLEPGSNPCPLCCLSSPSPFPLKTLTCSYPVCTCRLPPETSIVSFMQGSFLLPPAPPLGKGFCPRIPCALLWICDLLCCP